MANGRWLCRDPPEEVVDALPLPAPQPSRQAAELWPALLVAAVALWLAGWALGGR